MRPSNARRSVGTSTWLRVPEPETAQIPLGNRREPLGTAVGNRATGPSILAKTAFLGPGNRTPPEPVQFWFPTRPTHRGDAEGVKAEWFSRRRRRRRRRRRSAREAGEDTGAPLQTCGAGRAMLGAPAGIS